MSDDPDVETGDEPAKHDIAYDTTGWTNRQRAKLTETLLNAGVSHEWSGTDLVVATANERYVDGLIFPD
ncbi:MAG TPA: hypothetical protein VED63_03410 [Acidimicrobiales bacterium]|nr:hypothetical protein [Acidimicrobiales bacterium]